MSCGEMLFTVANMAYILGMTDFVKMHGLGNDFVVLDARGDASSRVGVEAAKAIADRRRGIGCDQILVMRNAENADLFMEILNSDGSHAKACGNGTRCVADLVMTESNTKKVTIATDGGLLAAWRDVDGLVSVDMGPAFLNWQDVPLASPMDTLCVDIDGAPGPAVCHSMGNPHAVIFVDDVMNVDVPTLGPAIEHAPIFPDRVNVSFVQKIEDGTFRMRVWERGVGITMACGSGACAVGVAIARRGLGGRKNRIVMDGGAVSIDWQEDQQPGGRVIMTGPVAYVCYGRFAGRLACLMDDADG
jgi:diaminopimelate epimerase